MTTALPRSPFDPALPSDRENRIAWRDLEGAAASLAIAEAARRAPGPLVLVTRDTAHAYRCEAELRVFGAGIGVELFPDWETLPYDVFSPHQDIVSQRLTALYRMPDLRRGVVIVPVATLLQRLLPRGHLDAHALLLGAGDRLDLEALRRRLEIAGYRNVAQVHEHGEYAVRGSLFDLFPMGSDTPVRIDLFDDGVESLRTFDPETQRTLEKIDRLQLLPAREFPAGDDATRRFRQAFRSAFEGDPQRASVYRDVSNGYFPGGIEYYLPLFYDDTATLFDYLPPSACMVLEAGVAEAMREFWRELESRYEQRRHDAQRPLLPPARLYLDTGEATRRIDALPSIRFDDDDVAIPHGAGTLPDVALSPRAAQPAQALLDFVAGFAGRVLFAAESPGRREALIELLAGAGLHPRSVEGWQAFITSGDRLAITVAPLERGLLLSDPAIAVIAEAQLLGSRAAQSRRRRARERDPDAIIRNLAELKPGAPVVHEDHGVGRYLGLVPLTLDGAESEFLALEYADGDKLYVPVASLHRIARYTGTAPEQAPLHKLGSGQWAKARRKAAEQARDVAAELLHLYARRAAREGHAFRLRADEYAAFAGAFPFEETPDQETAIRAVLDDMTAGRPMDRVVCGDVGFGKTEVAMRAAFVAVQGGRQVALLVPTTLLAQQHFQNFRDRFADWPVRVELLSRFRSGKEQDAVLAGLEQGTVDIVVTTHKILSSKVAFRNLGLVIVDEEHRFGVRQKERLKELRAEVDFLTLTATPIPRTLNMAMSGLRDLSIIATPPARRLAIKTFQTEWNDALLVEAIQRELKRGGQVYFVHNEVESIERMTRTVEALAPGARVAFAHGQMRESELERVMLDFYHQRFSILVCTTIIESGIDVPSANTIIVNRADRFGLAQLHQLRGRVGRSHHRAYAYLVVPPRAAMTGDAAKRLDALASLEDLGAGFMLATHDLEIRGAGELLGDEQSGQIQEVGYSLYAELLARAVAALRAGQEPDLDQPFDHGPEVELRLPALLPADYVPDVHARLVLYKRIAGATDHEQLRELQVELIDRFGLLPEAARTLFRVTGLKLDAAALGVQKVEAGPSGGRLHFGRQPNVDPAAIIRLIQTRAQAYRMDGPERLRFTADLEEPAERVEFVADLLQRLAPGSSAAAPR